MKIEELISLSESIVTKPKSFADTFLYYKGDYEKNIFKFLVGSERLDKNANSFEEIRYEVKKQQITSSLIKVLDSNNIILMINNTPMPRAFKVFVGTDPKDKKIKSFIDVSEIISSNNGEYTFQRKSINILIAYLTSAMNSMIYHTEPNRIIGNSTIIKYGTNAFAKLFTYVIDYLRMGGVPNIRETTLYLSAIYFQVNLLEKDINDSIIIKAKNLSGLSDIEIAKINYYISDIEEPYKNIKVFINTLATALKTDKLTIDVFINKWMYLFASGTQFSTELYTSFADMMINVYANAYLNHQATIEKIVGIDMTEFVNAIFQIGGDAL